MILHEATKSLRKKVRGIRNLWARTCISVLISPFCKEKDVFSLKVHLSLAHFLLAFNLQHLHSVFCPCHPTELAFAKTITTSLVVNIMETFCSSSYLSQEHWERLLTFFNHFPFGFVMLQLLFLLNLLPFQLPVFWLTLKSW